MSIAGGLNVDVDRIRKNWGWYVALGAILILLGGVAIASPFGVGLAVMVVLGILLIASGVAEIVVAIQTRGWQGIALNLLAGILEIVVGIVVLKCPVTSLVVIPPAAARNLARNLRQQIILSLIIGLFGGAAGTVASYHWDIPCGPAIVMACIAVFIVSLVASKLWLNQPVKAKPV